MVKTHSRVEKTCRNGRNKDPIKPARSGLHLLGQPSLPVDSFQYKVLIYRSIDDIRVTGKGYIPVWMYLKKNSHVSRKMTILYG
jgi:hypothetical protein